MKRVALSFVLAGVLLAACSSESGDQVFVSAAASLTDAFASLESAFEESHPDIDVILNLGGSSALREQILAGAPADVFASANQPNMSVVADSGLVSGEAVIFATNRLEIAVPSGNPAGVIGLEDFGNPDLVIGLCSGVVPCGDFARRALESADVRPSVDTDEPNVRALLTKIEAGELDAGIVYATDVVARGGLVEGIPIDAAHNVPAGYPIAVLNSGNNQDDALTFVGFVMSTIGRQILLDHGFELP